MLSEKHVNHFLRLVLSKKFKKTVFNLLSQGETSLRLKCHEILEVVGTYFTQFCSSKTLYELQMPARNDGRG